MTLERYERHLPHWRVDNAIYFVTWRIHRAQAVLTFPERALVFDALEYFDQDRYDLFARVVMDDHAHVLFSIRGALKLEKILHTWKSFTANRLQRLSGRVGRIWQDESFDHIVRDEASFIAKIAYIANNPRKRWPGIEHYAWVAPIVDADGHGSPIPPLDRRSRRPA